MESSYDPEFIDGLLKDEDFETLKEEAHLLGREKEAMDKMLLDPLFQDIVRRAYMADPNATDTDLRMLARKYKDDLRFMATDLKAEYQSTIDRLNAGYA